MVFMILPCVLVNPYAGILADRKSGRTVMTIANILTAMMTASLIFVHNLWQLYVILALIGTVDTFFSPAETSMVKKLVKDEDMAQATAIRTIVAQGTKIIGPGLSGILVAAFGSDFPFGMAAIFFLSSAMIVRFLPAGFNGRLNPVAVNLSMDDASSGFQFLWKHGQWRFLLLFFGFLFFVLQMVDSQFVILLRHVSGASRILGFSMTASGMGMVVVAIYLGRVKTLRAGAWMIFGQFAMDLGLISCALSVHQHVSWAVPLLVIMSGGGATMAIVPFETLLLQSIPVQWTGRAMATVSMISSAAALAGPVVGAIVVMMLRALFAFFLAGLLLMVGGVAQGMVVWRLRGVNNAQSQSGV
jgi:hypothetical protein